MPTCPHVVFILCRRRRLLVFVASVVAPSSLTYRRSGEIWCQGLLVYVDFVFNPSSSIVVGYSFISTLSLLLQRFVALLCRRRLFLVSVATDVAPSSPPYRIAFVAFSFLYTISPLSFARLGHSRRRTSSSYSLAVVGCSFMSPVFFAHRLHTLSVGGLSCLSLNSSRHAVIITLLCRRCRILFTVTAVVARNIPPPAPSSAALFSLRRRLPSPP